MSNANIQYTPRGSQYTFDVYAATGDQWIASAKSFRAGDLVGDDVEARAAWRIGPICKTCGDDGDCPDCGTYTGTACDFCSQQALYFVQYPLGVFAYCPVCYEQRHGDVEALLLDNRPLLAQCAALCDALLGGPVIGGGILDELRRVRAALAYAGW